MVARKGSTNWKPKFDLQEAAANDTNMVKKVAAMEAKVQNLQETLKNTIESGFQTLKLRMNVLKQCRRGKSAQSRKENLVRCVKKLFLRTPI